MAEDGDGLYKNRYAIPVLEVFQVVRQKTITVGDTPTKLPTDRLTDRKSLLIENKSLSKTVFIGDSTVTANNESTGGCRLLIAEKIQFNLNNVDIYGIVASGTAPVTVLEFG